jgi:hypothetical protein
MIVHEITLESNGMPAPDTHQYFSEAEATAVAKYHGYSTNEYVLTYDDVIWVCELTQSTQDAIIDDLRAELRCDGHSNPDIDGQVAIVLASKLSDLF